MKYMLLIYSNESQWQGLAKSEIDQRMAAYLAYTEAMTKAGVILGGDRLRSADATTTVRVANGKTNVLNGPYAETREQLGGYYLIDVPISTRRCPGRRAARAPATARSRCGRSGRCSGQP